MENGNSLMIFEGNKVEVFEFNGKILFNPKDVGKCLELTEAAQKKQIQRMNDKQVIKLKNSDFSKETNCPFRKLHNVGENFITESGVYKMIFASRCKLAEKFQDWVTDEVLPQIRKTGGYIPISQEDTEEEINRKAQEIAKKTVQEYKNLLKEKDEEIIKLTKINDMNSGGDWQKLDYSNAIVRISLNNNQYINVNIQDIKDYLERNYFSKIKETFVDEDGQEWSSNKFKEERKVCNRFKRDKYGNILISQEGRKAIVRYMIKKLNCQLIIDNSRTNNYF